MCWVMIALMVVMMYFPLINASEDTFWWKGYTGASTEGRAKIAFQSSPIRTRQEAYSGENKWGAAKYHLSEKDSLKLLEEFRRLKIEKERGVGGAGAASGSS